VDGLWKRAGGDGFAPDLPTALITARELQPAESQSKLQI
jgi:hypothetical protein